MNKRKGQPRGVRALLRGVDDTGEGSVIEREVRLRPDPQGLRNLLQDARACGYTGLVLRRLPVHGARP